MNHDLSYRPVTRRRLFALAAAAVALDAVPLGSGRLPHQVATARLETSPDGELSGLSSPPSGAAASPVASPVVAIADPRVAAIEGLIAAEVGVYGIVLMNPDGSVVHRKNGDTPFVSASLYKLVLMADICRAVDDGLLFLDTPLYLAPDYFDVFGDGFDSYFDPSFAGYETTVAEAIFATGAYSSNVAAKVLLSITTVEDLNATAADLGLTGTFLFTDPTQTPNWPPSPGDDSTSEDAATAQRLVLSYATDGQVNLTTPMDMARFFVLLLHGRVYNERVSSMILEVLRQQMIDDRFPALLPPGTQFAHKTGNLDQVVHDVGVIEAPSGPVILAAMVEGPSNDERATQVVQRLALIAYGIEDLPPVTAPVYPEMGTPIAIDGTTVQVDVDEPAETVAGATDSPVDGTE